MRYDSPTHEELQALVGRALVDPEFRRDLLNGRRRERLAEFALSTEEQEAAVAVEAGDLASFARQLDAWIGQQPAPRPQERLPAAGGLRLWEGWLAG